MSSSLKQNKLNILKALISTKCAKKTKLTSLHLKLSLAPFWNMQTPYGTLSYQTSRNCKPFRTQLCSLLLAAHETQTLNTFSNGHPSQGSFYSLKKLTETQVHPLHLLTADSNPPKNIETAIFYNNDHTKTS